jgi:dipeptidyl aminopeptidase/acylaminoacyl peptidase
MPARGPLSPDLIVGLASPNNAVLSPRGDAIAYTLDERDAQRLYLLPLDGGAPRLLTPELRRYGQPSWAPDGKRLVAVADNTLWQISVAGGQAKKLWQHPAGISQPAWSPDGATIAFRSRAQGWDQLYALPYDGGEPRRLTDAPADNEAPAWSPGARFVAYTSIRNDLLARDIYLVDAASGREECITAGSSCVNLASAWSPAGGRLAFLSERDGWLHLYTRERDGSVQQLTAGPWEDGHLAATAPGALCWSPDGARLAFLRNRDGCFDIMLADADGQSPRRLSSGDGNWGLLGWLPDGKRLAATFDSPTQPPDVWLLDCDGGNAEQLTFSAAGFRPSDLATPQRVQYAARDGKQIGAWLYRPTNAGTEQRAPALLVAHGGPSSQNRASWQPLMQLLAQEGYAVLLPDFRGSTGYGRAFRQANFGAWGTADLGDVIDGAEWLRSQPEIDSARMGVYGGSYGGYLVLCALTRSPQTFCCGVDLYGDSEIAASYRHGDRVGRLDMHRQMGAPDEQAEAYRRGSPLYAAEQIAAPLLILHGRDDRRVVPLMSEKMIEALTIEGKFFESHFYEGEAHGFRTPAARKDSMERTLAFLRRHLKGEQPAE